MTIILVSVNESILNSDSVRDLKPVKYILFEVNHGEGFNLRRDVYMRIAVFVKKLNVNFPDRYWVLVLPPWGHLYHWQSEQLGHQVKIPWSTFFNIQSLGLYVPVIEFEEWLSVTGGELGTVYYLQAFKEGWESGKFEDKWELRDCIKTPKYRLNKDSKFEGHFFFYGNKVFADRFACLSVQGHASVLESLVKDLPDSSILLDRAETVLHDWFGDVEYWGCRRSMVFAPALLEDADSFIKTQLGEEVGISREQDWKRIRNTNRNSEASGGSYGCVHLRRGDFAKSRKKEVPTIKGAAKQIAERMRDKGLDKIFIATDGTKAEVEEIKKSIQKAGIQVHLLKPERNQMRKFKDGGIAILEQIICSRAKYFLGTKESTFTFRIQEEREILGVPPEETFDMLCNDKEWKEGGCEGGIKWLIEWDTDEHKWPSFSKQIPSVKTEL